MNRNIEFMREIILIKLKSIKEFKSNLYLSTVLSFFITSINIVFLSIFINIFPSILPWTYIEIIFFGLLGSIIAMIFGNFVYNSALSRYLLNGNIIHILLKPINTFQYYFFESSLFFVFLSVIIDSILFGLFLIFFVEIDLFKLVISFILALIGGIFYIVFYRFLDSLGFFIKDNFFLKTIGLRYNEIFNRYPTVIFQGNLKYVGFLSANTFFSIYVTHYYFGYISLAEILPYYLFCIFLILLFSIGIYLLWKQGLKKYEAFG